MVVAALEGFCHDPRGAGIVPATDPDPKVTRFEVGDKLQHYVFRSGAWSVACQDAEVVLLDG